MSEPVVIVTGANGFIGASLVRHFRALGWDVRALVRNPPREPVDGVAYSRYDLSRAPDGSVFSGARYMVHCAYARHPEDPDSYSVNLEGTRRLVDLCRKWDVKPLFLSSFSAHEGAKSHYGISKLRIESLFDLSRDLVLKPGLVVGRGGLFGTMVATATNHAFVPLVGTGNQLVQTIALEDLCLLVERGLASGVSGIYWVANPTPLKLREIYEDIAAWQGRKIRFVPIPTWSVLLACQIAEMARIRLPLSSDSVLGLKNLRTFDTTADVLAFGVHLRTFRESLASLPKPNG